MSDEKLALSALARDTSKIDRETRFAGSLFAALAIVLPLMMIGIWSVRSDAMTASNWVELTAIPALFGYAAWRYLGALRRDSAGDWTLAARLQSEKEKMARRIRLYKQLPTHVLLPLFLVIVVGVIVRHSGVPDEGASPMGLAIYLVSAVLLFVGTAWGLKMEARRRLIPMFERLEQLEDQLQNGL